MQKKEYTVRINASKEKVWEALWNDANYRLWTSAFSEGSYAVSDWQEGSKIHFLTPEGLGMFSIIERKVPYEVMSFRHQGEIKDGVEQPLNEKTQSWAGATETYTLHENGGQTQLTVTLDIDEAHAPYFEQTFPKALQKVAALAEA